MTSSSAVARGTSEAFRLSYTPLPTELLTYNANTLASLTLPTGYAPYSIELASTTQAEVGAGTNVISGERRSYAELERTANVAASGGGASLAVLSLRA